MFCYFVSAARVEWERGLPAFPPAGSGLHLVLWEEDAAGGAGEGLHVLQACKEILSRALSSIGTTSLGHLRSSRYILFSHSHRQKQIQPHPAWEHCRSFFFFFFGKRILRNSFYVIKGKTMHFYHDKELLYVNVQLLESPLDWPATNQSSDWQRWLGSLLCRFLYTHWSFSFGDVTSLFKPSTGRTTLTRWLLTTKGISCHLSWQPHVVDGEVLHTGISCRQPNCFLFLRFECRFPCITNSDNSVKK